MKDDIIADLEKEQTNLDEQREYEAKYERLKHENRFLKKSIDDLQSE